MDLRNIDSFENGAIDLVAKIEPWCCLLYTSDAADDLLCVDLGVSRIIKKKIQHIT